MKIRIITSTAYHALFMHNMLIRPSKQEREAFGEPDFVIYNGGAFPANKVGFVSMRYLFCGVIGAGGFWGAQLCDTYLGGAFAANKVGVFSLCILCRDSSSLCLFWVFRGYLNL